MLVQAPKWTDFLSCLICQNGFESSVRRPVSLGCGHTICKSCLLNLQRRQCPYDQTAINTDINNLPENHALLQLVGEKAPTKLPAVVPLVSEGNIKYYLEAKKSIEEIALYLKPPSSLVSSILPKNPLSKPLQRKLVTLINCQLIEEEGRKRAIRTVRSVGERTVTELILQHQNAQALSTNLWAVVRARGCQFLGPAMQEEVLKLLLLALEDGSALSRKVLVLFVVQRLSPHFPQASKTSIGHVVQLLYRASCFKVSKRDKDSSLMQLKEEFCTYEALRREHDAQIVQIAIEAGLRITPEQWSALLYGDTAHKSHMQSIIDKLQTPQAFSQSLQELLLALQRNGDPGHLLELKPHLELLAGIESSPNVCPPSWEDLNKALGATVIVVRGLYEYIQNFGNRKLNEIRLNSNVKYKTSMCRDLLHRRNCPRGLNCTFAHSERELEQFKGRNIAAVDELTSASSSRNFTFDDFSGGQSDTDISVSKSVVASNSSSFFSHSSFSSMPTLSDCTTSNVYNGIYLPEVAVDNSSSSYLCNGYDANRSLLPNYSSASNEQDLYQMSCSQLSDDHSSTNKSSQVSVITTILSNILDYKSWCHADPPS
ncbi:roquin-1-like [Argiope bruennichi]|uniref:RING-type E3 ubiquitin transferase n=1 Tax=Argiope bruennichi TaxID=94029 RepID=A0A8T0E8S9_ARGBR|nr:roquin-1-like [Argiope bruennichi]XP_055937048.1 roquin-1-like [Argiope bruennichi]XP_055937049.1 roquin-1-like [Argiope bruennichi]XP_055937050.1 roquin-1-like [Argiope bruennichi]KAF8767282.1 Roquin-1 like protein [Argiope bruennichi]